MAYTTGKFTSFQISCPYCFDENATVLLDLNNLDECCCSFCEQEFSPVQARDLAAAELARWEEVLRWIARAAPAGGD